VAPAPGRWSDDFVRQVRERADIVAVVSDVVALRRAGRSWIGLCPFHEEKTPSFTVSPERGMFHCFGCQAGGDAISFVMRQQGLDFRDAVQVLAERFGVPLPQAPRSPAEERAAAQREGWLRCCELAAAHFQRALRAEPRARAYLAARGVSEASIAAWRLGYAGPGWDGLASALRQAGVPAAVGEQLGLLARRPRGDGHYDVFRDRVMFPIADERGRIIGFGGRTLGDDPRKYINSRESPLFAKRRVWYGLHLARQAMRQGGRAIVVEGYFDAIMAHQHGFAATVASLGTSLSPEQAGSLARYAEEIVVAYDADAAGAAATRRGLGLLQGGTARVRVLDMPAGRDPDEWLREAGPEAFAAALDSARPLLEYLVGSVAARSDLTRLGGRLAAAREVAPLLARTPDAAERATYVEWAARRRLLDDPAVLGELVRRHLTEKGEGYRNRSDWHPTTVSSAGRPPAAPPRRVPSGAVRAQEGILALAGRHPRLAASAMAALEPADFDAGELRALAEALWAARAEVAGAAEDGVPALQRLLDGPLPEPARGLAARLLLAEEWEGDPERLLQGCMATLRRVRLQERLDAIRASQRRLEAAGQAVPDEMKRETGLLEREIADLKGRASGRATAGGRV
jgi:DNA primase